MNINVIPTKLFTSIDCKQGAVRSVRFNVLIHILVDGNYCISTGSDKTIKLWNPHRKHGLLLQNYIGHGAEVLDACGSCDNSFLASCGVDKLVLYWDVGTAKTMRKFRGHGARVNAVAFNEESSVVFSASVDGSVKAWDCRSHNKAPIQTFDEAQDSVTCLTVTNHELLTGSADHRIRRYDLREGQAYVDFVSAESITSVNFTQDGQCCLVSSLDSTVRLFDKDTGELLADYTGHKNSEFKVDSCLSNSDAHVFSGCEDGNVIGWDLVEGKRLCKLVHPVTRVVHSITFHPKQPILVSACVGLIYVWSTDENTTGI